MQKMCLREGPEVMERGWDCEWIVGSRIPHLQKRVGAGDLHRRCDIRMLASDHRWKYSSLITECWTCAE